MLDRLKTLFAHTAVYGLGDVATSVVSLLLLPVFTRYLTPADYGVLQLLLAAEAVLKPTIRCGLGSAFLRMYYDAGAAHRERLVGTVFLLQLAIVAPLTGPDSSPRRGSRSSSSATRRTPTCCDSY